MAPQLSVPNVILHTMTEITARERCACPEPHPTADHNDPTCAKYNRCGCCMVDCPDVHGPEGRLPTHYHYHAEWSDSDGEFVGLATAFPSLSSLAPTPYEALAGIESLVADTLRDMAKTGESPPAPDTTSLDGGGE